MPGITLDEAHLLSTSAQDVFYGIYIVSFFFAMRALLWDTSSSPCFRGVRTINWVYLGVVLQLAVLSTISVTVLLRQNFEALIWSGGDCAIGKEKYFVFANWMSFAGVGVVLFQSLVIDAVLLYRCYMTYMHRWKIVLAPAFLWLATFACSITILAISAELSTFPTFLNPQLRAPVAVHLTFTALQNSITTGLIMYKIGSIERENWTANSWTFQTVLQFSLRLIMDSGFIYVLASFVTLLSAVKNTNSDFVSSSIFLQITSSLFNLSMIRSNYLSNRPSTPASVLEESCLSDPFSRTRSPQPVTIINLRKSMSVTGNLGIMTTTTLDSNYSEVDLGLGSRSSVRSSMRFATPPPSPTTPSPSPIGRPRSTQAFRGGTPTFKSMYELCDGSSVTESPPRS
ncbi:hypothetical protein BDN72DRAFT_862585 [Pluteus cervinus]|uniref:Uncharacterized protein n=1 Tax=Pluteus cervinus TaxID=181527 RepID=A0ACD3AB77_9AGAR|nr:hypothetical protein BDN72DRAFT_862585 [Pluteus cervinus]